MCVCFLCFLWDGPIFRLTLWDRICTNDNNEYSVHYDFQNYPGYEPALTIAPNFLSRKNAPDDKSGLLALVQKLKYIYLYYSDLFLFASTVRVGFCLTHPIRF